MKSLKIKFSLILAAVLVAIFTITAYADTAYIFDKAGVLNKSTISTVNEHFSELETATGAQVKIAIVPSLKGETPTAYAKKIAKAEANTDKYAVFLVSIKEHHNKFIVGAGLTNLFDASEKTKIASLPNSYFKSGNFDEGILAVSKSIYNEINNATVKNSSTDNASDGKTEVIPSTNSIQDQRPYKQKSNAGLYIFLLVAIITLVFIGMMKRRNDKRVRDFSRRTGLGENSKGFKSTKASASKENYNNASYQQGSNVNGSNGPIPNNNANNTYIYDNSAGFNQGLVQGMIIDELMHNHEHEHEHHHDDYDDHDNFGGGSGFSGGDSNWGSDSSGDSSWGGFDSGGDSSWGGSDSGGGFDSGSSGGDSNW